MSVLPLVVVVSGPSVMKGGTSWGESLMQLEVVTGGPRAVPSALATVLTPSFDLPLIGSFLTYEAGDRAIGQKPLRKTSFQTHPFVMGP